jgi:hypothetical protein
VGFVMRGSKTTAIAADRDRWMKQAHVACITAAKEMIGNDGPIRPLSPIGRLGDDEWTTIVGSVVWAWIATRSEQAAAEGWNEERAIRAAGLDPDPWFDGAVAAVLPRLAEACPDLDWSKPVGEWAKDDVVAFLIAGFDLVQHALAARDAAEKPPDAGGANLDLVAREINAAAGNPLMTGAEHRELKLSDCPF